MLRGDPAGLMTLKVDLDNVGCLFRDGWTYEALKVLSVSNSLFVVLII